MSSVMEVISSRAWWRENNLATIQNIIGLQKRQTPKLLERVSRSHLELKPMHEDLVFLPCAYLVQSFFKLKIKLWSSRILRTCQTTEVRHVDRCQTSTPATEPVRKTRICETNQV
jgi:hypothetical protein